MSKKTADIQSRGAKNPAGAASKAVPRRVTHSQRLERESRQQRIAYLALFGTIALIIVTLVVGGLWEWVIGPAQAAATVNGVSVRTDTFNRFTKFEAYMLNAEYNQVQFELSKLQQDTKNAAANASLTQQLTQQGQLIQSNEQSLQAYTISQMQTALMLTQAATKIHAAPTDAQLNTQINALRTQVGGASGFSQILSTGVTMDDLKTYYAAPIVVQTNVTTKLQGTVSATEHEAKARHILVKTKALATQILTQLQHGGNFAALAKQYSIDNGLGSTSTLTGTAKLNAENQSSAFNGGWLRDPSTPGSPSQPGWLTPQTQFVAPVLNAILAMKPNEYRIVQSTYGYHVIQVTEVGTLKLTKAQVQSQLQQQGQTRYSTWQSTAVDPNKNKLSPANPYEAYPPATATN